MQPQDTRPTTPPLTTAWSRLRTLVLIGIGLLLVLGVVIALSRPPSQQGTAPLATSVAGLNQASATLGAVGATSEAQLSTPVAGLGDAVATLGATTRGEHPATPTPSP